MRSSGAGRIARKRPSRAVVQFGLENTALNCSRPDTFLFDQSDLGRADAVNRFEKNHQHEKRQHTA